MDVTEDVAVADCVVVAVDDTVEVPVLEAVEVTEEVTDDV